ncbi:MAG: type I-MYXAN CRISPR-associated Cas8a1/Cmx1, partial [Oscillatoria sp. PMC 1076.18]|nr:type I-MYXAN CRISPR-associated Cas8a1/Cmx1 [Oscillatoria sp. PMC 1076.18]
MSKLHLSLNASDTTLIHRAGILGLWMTLKQLEQQFPNHSQRLGELSWKLTPHSVSLDWTGQDEEVLDWLLKQAFQIDKRGLITLIGLKPQSMPLINKIHLHQALTATLLQHNQFVTPITRQYKVYGITLKKTAPHYLLNLLIKSPIPLQFYVLAKGKLDAIKSVNLTEDKVNCTLNYKGLSNYIHQDFSQQLCHSKTHQLIKDYIPIVSWLYPGAIIRHELIRKFNQCKERPKYAFALLFLPVACHYLILSKGINEQLKSKKNHPIKYLLVIPDPINLEKSAQIRWRLNDTHYRDLYVSSLAEAGLNYYINENQRNFSSQRCQVILYDKLMKTSQLRNPVDIQDFYITSKTLQTYQLAQRHLQPNQLIPTEVNFLIRLNLIRGIIAENILKKQSIWRNLWLILKQKDSSGEIKQQLNY